MDIKNIEQLYEDALKSLRDDKDKGKAKFALANLIDQQIHSFYEEWGDQVGPASNLRGSTFWGKGRKPDHIGNFLKENVPKALDYYFESVRLSENYAYEAVPRILWLCFDMGVNFTEQGSKFGVLKDFQKRDILEDVQTKMKGAERLPAKVWLSSITQLSSRISQPPELERTLFLLIQMALRAFPQESLWQLMSVAFSCDKNRKGKFEELWRHCSKGNKELEELKNKFQEMTQTLIDFCKKPFKEGTYNIEKCDRKLKRVMQSTQLRLPISGQLDRKGDSGSLRIDHMNDEILVLHSLQTPRKIEIVADDGSIFHFLCKQDDDLRKDMRMMEFARFVNLLLAGDRRCRDRNRDLRLATFAVILLDEKCGIIEWVEGTSSLQGIVNNLWKMNGIQRSNSEWKKLCEDTNGGINARINRYREFQKRFPPVMHLWFAKKSQSRWFPARLVYTRSTALWSIVGYLLGLGDRHTENILFQDSGMCVHVDFNCLFDKAKELQVPDKVPFRLTPNIIDGMGPLGTDGLFTKTAELVIKTLRGKKQKLVGVLRPFIYDPLLEWRRGGRGGLEVNQSGSDRKSVV
jgi:serine/threonine-protein kinase ATR